MELSDNKLDENKQAVLLLTCYFSKQKKGDFTPLTQIEYGRFAKWLKENSYQPKDLFHQKNEIQKKWTDPKKKITEERLKFLLGRGMAMGIALEKWQSAGIWIITRAEHEYPQRLKKMLRENAPAVLFGVGNKRLLSAGGLAIVGSRNINETDEKYTDKISKQAALEGLNIVSGGARGVDEAAMLAALEIEGTAIGVLANDLFKSALSNKWRKFIRASQLVLISPFYPEAGFHVGNAMGRNKYIYCLADYALIVRSEEGVGGTWAGALENLKSSWVPTFVKDNSDASGNSVLKKKGALVVENCSTDANESIDWLTAQLTKNELLENEKAGAAPVEEIEINKNIEVTVGSETVPHLSSDKEGKTVNGKEGEKELDRKLESGEIATNKQVEDEQEEIYEDKDSRFIEFTELLKQFLKESSKITLAEIREKRKDLKPKQITDWLDRASLEGLVERQGRLRSYTLKKQKEQQDLF